MKFCVRRRHMSHYSSAGLIIAAKSMTLPKLVEFAVEAQQLYTKLYFHGRM